MLQNKSSMVDQSQRHIFQTENCFIIVEANSINAQEFTFEVIRKDLRQKFRSVSEKPQKINENTILTALRRERPQECYFELNFGSNQDEKEAQITFQVKSNFLNPVREDFQLPFVSSISEVQLLNINFELLNQKSKDVINEMKNKTKPLNLCYCVPEQFQVTSSPEFEDMITIANLEGIPPGKYLMKVSFIIKTNYDEGPFIEFWNSCEDYPIGGSNYQARKMDQFFPVSLRCIQTFSKEESSYSMTCYDSYSYPFRICNIVMTATAIGENCRFEEQKKSVVNPILPKVLASMPKALAFDMNEQGKSTFSLKSVQIGGGGKAPIILNQTNSFLGQREGEMIGFEENDEAESQGEDYENE